MVIVAAPASGWYAFARIRTLPSSGARLAAYRLAIAALLSGTAAAFLLVPPRMMFGVPIHNRDAGWLPSRELISALAIGLTLITTLPVLLARRGGVFRDNLRAEIEKLRDLLPHTRRERLWFASAAICAGICEEVLYRGFLLYYLHAFPWKIGFFGSIAIACAVFGLAHIYQGLGGVLQTVLLALGLCVLFLSTRSLLLPMLLHVAIDLRIFIVLPDILAPHQSEAASSAPARESRLHRKLDTETMPQADDAGHAVN